ncbi:MAG: pentapeptide repeat-containing protein [Planctomycetaceae bacterium]
MNSKQYAIRWQDSDFLANAKTYLNRLFLDKQPCAGLDLRGLVVGLDGEMELLKHHDFQDTSLRDSDVSFGRFSCAFSRCRWTSIKLDGVEFDACRFKDGNFEKCTMVKTRIDSPLLDDCSFTDCVFNGTTIAGRGFNEYGGKRVAFVRCRFANTCFNNLQIRAGRFVDCEFVESIFSKCLLSGTSFSGPASSVASFAECELTQCTANGTTIL